MGETKSSIYSRICSIESRSSNASLHLVFVRAFEQEDFSEFLNLVQGSFGGADELDVASATTALHRLARRWSREGPGLAGSDRSVRQTLDVLALLSQSLAKTFRSKPFAGSGLQPRHMAITAWAVASLIRCRALKLCGADFARLLGALGEAAVPQLPEFDGQSLSNLLWGLAVARQVHRRVFFVASRRAIQLLKRGDLVGQNLSNVLWSFSQARLPNHALFEEAARHPEIFAESHQPSPQHITNILWAFSRIHGKIGMFRDFFDAGAEAAISKLHLFKTQELANILWTFANQTLHHDGLFSAVADHARGRIAEFENFDLSQLLWSFAKVWWRDEELLREAAQDMLHGKTRRLKQMCAQDLGCVLWAFAMLQWQDAGLFEALAQAVRQHFATLKPLDVGNVAWALAVSEQMDVQTAKLIADHVLSVAGFGTAEGQKLKQLRGTFAEQDEKVSAMRQELALLEAWVGELQLEHLGPDFTQRLAAECELWQPSRAEEGREVLAWVAFSLDLEADNQRAFISEPGQIVTYGRADREFCPHWQAAEKLLMPLTTTSHSRGGHAERVAMLQVFSAALKCADQLGGNCDLMGDVWLHISHWPCISCMAVLCQVLALAPDVRLHVSWEGFTPHSEPHAPTGDAWTASETKSRAGATGRGVGLKAEVDHKDRAACAEIYSQIRSAVKVGMDYLLSAREDDPFEDMPGRYAWEQATGVQAPSFDLRKWGPAKLRTEGPDDGQTLSDKELQALQLAPVRQEVLYSLPANMTWQWKRLPQNSFDPFRKCWSDSVVDPATQMPGRGWHGTLVSCSSVHRWGRRANAGMLTGCFLET
ncbi:RAP domain-containing protein [Durusdinium trenchii]|uniref:Chloroplastic (Protein ALBINO LEAF 1) n=1 Tax=Durusdinium trenchii TaxID=1381693 RepID=A0ABP0JTG9_9DINO